jgi:hypothetical protein
MMPGRRDAIEDEGGRRCRVRNGEEARPEVVVLALAERRRTAGLAIETARSMITTAKERDENSAAH